MPEKTCDTCWEEPCTCRAFFEVSAPVYTFEKEISSEEKARLLSNRHRIARMLELRTLRDMGSIEREDFEREIVRYR